VEVNAIIGRHKVLYQAPRLGGRVFGRV